MRRAAEAKDFIDNNPARFSWTRADYQRIAKQIQYELHDDMIRVGIYRPFFKQALAFDQTLNAMTYRLPRLYPTPESENLGISIAGPGKSAPFGCIATNAIPELQVLRNSKHYARWRYEDAPRTPMLVDAVPAGRVSNLNPQAVARFRAALGDDLTDDDVFYYVYGILHAPEFRSTFESASRRRSPAYRSLRAVRSSTRSPPPAAISATSTSATSRSTRTRSPRNGWPRRIRMPTPTCSSSALAR